MLPCFSLCNQPCQPPPMSEGRALGFIGCYLLQSLHEKAKGRSYIGFTVNPRRRIRQHNGEITNGAVRTKKWRPWEMVLVVHGFATQTAALQFEWAWQHPERSLDMREAAAKVGRKARYGVKGKVLMLMEMLNTSPWKYYPLKVQFLSGEGARLRAGAPPLPAHMDLRVGPLEDLPEEYSDTMGGSGSGGDDVSFAGAGESSMLVGGLEDAEELSLSQRPKSGRSTSCIVCGSAATRTWAVCAQCSVRSHLGCLAERFLEDLGESAESSSSMPTAGRCPCCGEATTWGKVLETSQHAGWAKHKKTVATKAQQQQQEEGASKKSKGAGAAEGRRRAAAAAPEGSASQVGLSEAKVSEEEEEGEEDCAFSPPAWLDERPPSMSDASEPCEALPWEDFCSTSPHGSERGSQQQEEEEVKLGDSEGGGCASSSSIEVVDLVSPPTAAAQRRQRSKPRHVEVIELLSDDNE